MPKRYCVRLTKPTGEVAFLRGKDLHAIRFDMRSAQINAAMIADDIADGIQVDAVLWTPAVDPITRGEKL